MKDSMMMLVFPTMSLYTLLLKVCMCYMLSVQRANCMLLFSQIECPPSAPVNMSVEVMYFKGTEFRANISWNPATFFGEIDRYVVYVSRKGEELLTNDSKADVNTDDRFRIVRTFI